MVMSDRDDYVGILYMVETCRTGAGIIAGAWWMAVGEEFLQRFHEHEAR